MIDPREKIKKIELLKYDPQWKDMFTASATEIKAILQDNCVDILHIGSTAIPNIVAKPIIDVMPVVKDINRVDVLNTQFEALGYVCMGEYGIPGRRFYWKSQDKRTHNVHLFEQGSSEINRYVAFRNFMLAHDHYAQAYSLLKQNLAKVFLYDIENYVNGKASFVQVIDYKAGVARSSQLNAEDNIIIEPYNPIWPKLAEVEISLIKELSKSLSYVSIEHIGSTAVPDLASKPIIDIFITIKSMSEATQWIKLLDTLGYIFWDENPDKAHLRFFKGMPPFGMKRTHHIHLMEAGTDVFEQSILFRNILRQDEKIRREYESLKLALAKSHSVDREGYTNLKSDFIENTLRSHGYQKPISR